MTDKKERFQHALEVVVDGSAQSQVSKERAAASRYLVSLLIKDNADLIDAEKIKAILSIIEMALEIENQRFFSC
ncbi:MAG: hypothetical protein ACRCRU_11725 [Vibrio sp.]|uniref:hypothetical protein n=1 Tax=Vibrio sp. TaxID=678 RepID=UPI003F362F8C